MPVRKKKIINREMREKVTARLYFNMQWKILKELYQAFPRETFIIIFLSCLTACAGFVDLKFVEISVNAVSSYLQDDGHDFIVILQKIGFFIFIFALLRWLASGYSRVSQRYQSKVAFRAEKKFINKLSDVAYENYESNSFYERLNLAKQASGQYANAVYGITQIAKILLTLLVYGVMLSKIHPLFVLLIFISVGVSTVAAAKVTDKQLDYWRGHVLPRERKKSYF